MNRPLVVKEIVRATGRCMDEYSSNKELDRVSAQARHDPLTGALNRKGMDEALERELSNVRRKETPLSVSLLDIDNFKKLNDAKGHATGDQALTHLASVARECMRPQDTLARYGGEEFIVLLPDSSIHEAMEAAQRMQHEVWSLADTALYRAKVSGRNCLQSATE